MPTLHLVSHTHWDREWYLTFQQFRIRLVHLLDHVLDLLTNDPDFKYFTLDGQTIVLEDYLQVRPEREAAIRALAQQGRLLIGPWYILPDEFLVGPEAHIRNLLQGERTARRFGAKMGVGYIPDPFGHIGQMPQILHGFGLQTACVQRGLDDQPCELWWDAPDGSRVLMAYLRQGYGNAAGLPTSDPERFIAEVHRLQDALLPHTAVPHLLLMHGTDHMEPPADTGAAIACARAEGVNIVHSTLPMYLQAVEASLAENQVELPVIRGELRSSKRSHLLPGVLSTRMWIKQRNRTCETLLEKWAEPFSLWAEMAVGPANARRLRHPTPLIRQAWRLLMECHPHDSICGCSIDQVHEEMRSRFDQVEQIGESITRQSLETLAEAANTQPVPRPPGEAELLKAIVVFNPGVGPRTDRAELEIELPPGLDNLEIVDENGGVLEKVTAYQVRACANGTINLQFIAPDVPSYGYRIFWLRARPQKAALPQEMRLPLRRTKAPPYRIQNEFFVVEASPADGTLTLQDRRSGATFSGLNRFMDGGDCGDEYNYSPPGNDLILSTRLKSIQACQDVASQRLKIALELRTPKTLSADRSARSARLSMIPILTEVCLYPGIPRLEIRTTLRNTAQDHRLRVHFPAPFSCDHAWHDGHFEIVRRPLGTPLFDSTWAEQPRPEVPQRRFTSIANEKIGLMIVNRGLPEVEVLPTPAGGVEIALTLLRCVGWLSRDDFATRRGHAGPMIPTPAAQMPGKHCFEYAIVPFVPSKDGMPPHEQAEAFNAPLKAIATDLHTGVLPSQLSMVQVQTLSHTSFEKRPFTITALKMAETEDGWILRGCNLTSRPLSIQMKPWRPFARAWQVSLAEEEQRPLSPGPDGELNLEVGAHQIFTVKLSDSPLQILG